MGTTRGRFQVFRELLLVQYGQVESDERRGGVGRGQTPEDIVCQGEDNG